MCIDQSRHYRSASNINDTSSGMMDGIRGNNFYRVAFDENVKGCLEIGASLKEDVCIREENVRHILNFRATAFSTM
jgi:hypothetical protein